MTLGGPNNSGPSYGAFFVFDRVKVQGIENFDSIKEHMHTCYDSKDCTLKNIK